MPATRIPRWQGDWMPSYSALSVVNLASCTGIDPVPSPWKGDDLASNLAGYNLVDSNGFEPLRFLQNGFTVRRLQPLGQLSLNLNTLSAMLLDSVKGWMKNVYIKAY